MPNITTKPKGTKGVFSIYGGCEEFMRAKDHQTFLFGGAGSGKTTAECLKLFLLCVKYPGVKALVTRNSYVALVKSALDTFERVARQCGYEIGKKNAGPNVIYRLGESKPTAYLFPYSKYTDPDGRVYEGQSKIVISSLSNAKDELGAEYDYVYVNQPELISESDWEFLITRANGRRGHAPYPLLFGDPNPEHERHWIKVGGYTIDEDETLTNATGQTYLKDEYYRQAGKFYTVADDKEIKDAKWRLIKSTYRDNPTIWDDKLGCFTANGEEMIGRLEASLSPVMARRLLDAEWCSFEGLVFGEVLDRNRHLRPRKEYINRINDNWDRYWCFDFGYDDAFTFHIFAKNPDKEEYVCYKYICHTGRTINEHAEQIRDITIGEPRPKLIVADRNPESIAILESELRMNILSAKKGPGSIKAGCNVLIDMLKNDELIFLEDSIVEEDPKMRSKKQPIGFIEEAENYRWDLTKTDEVPIGGQDHCIDAVRYLMTFIKASQKTIPFVWL